MKREALMQTGTTDLDYLAARLHGRRSRLGEAERLEELCRLRSIPELGSALYPEQEFQTAGDLQRELVQDLMGEVAELAGFVTGPGARLLGWMLVRFQVENLKRLARAFATRTPLEVAQRHLLFLPKTLELKTPALAIAGSLAEFIGLVPKGPLQDSLEEVAETYGEPVKPFFLEAALDRGYFRELLARVGRVSDEHHDAIQALVSQEVDIFHLMLVSRGRFLYRLTPALLLPLHVEGTDLSRARLIAMLGEVELHGAAELAVGHVLDFLAPEPKGAPALEEPARLETLAWARYLRLANASFRRSPIGLGAVFGYIGIRRVEVANLITLSEGIRAGLGVEAIRARMVPRSDLETAYA